MTTTLPQWAARLHISRPPSEPGFGDLLPLVTAHYRLHEQAAQVIGPYNAKQRAAGTPYLPPTRDHLREVIRQGSVNDFTYHAFIAGLVRFCEATQGRRALPTPHPSVIHSIQLPQPAFSLQPGPMGDTMVKVIGLQVPLVVKGLRDPVTVKFVIVRPRLSKLGTASAVDWEILLFRQNLGYVVDWVDTNLNPRWSGIF